MAFKGASNVWRGCAFAATLIAVLLAPSARASAVVSGGTLLTQSYADEIAGELGQSNVDFTLLFTKQPGNTESDFHAAADGKGPTVSLMDVFIDGKLAGLIGGYDPVSWRSDTTFTMNGTDAGRTAFLFNLTTSTFQRQNLTGQGLPNSGQYQTDNTGLGPIFGGGWDLFVPADLTTGGYTNNYSYGGTSFGTNILGNSGVTSFSTGALEVYAVSAGTGAPEPSSAALGLGGGLLVACLWVMKRRVGERRPSGTCGGS